MLTIVSSEIIKWDQIIYQTVVQQSQQFLFFFASFLTMFEPVSEKWQATQKRVNERTAPFQSSKLCLVRNMLRLQKCKLPESVSFVDWFCCVSYQEHGWTTVAMPRESSGSQAWRRTNDYSIYSISIKTGQNPSFWTAQYHCMINQKYWRKPKLI